MEESGKHTATNIKKGETPLQMKNTQVIISKIKSDITKIMGEHILNPLMTTKEFEVKVRKHILEYLPRLYEDFDIDLFDLALVPVPNKLQVLSIQPQNFITSLWMQGISVLYSKIEGKDSYTDDIATYTWNDEKKLLGIKPHTNIDFI